MSQHTLEISRGERFAFGENWRQFLAVLNEERIAEAEKSLQTMLGVRDLADKSFLDIGCGSGLFSLAARRLGARVHSFDYDPRSAACADELKRRFFQDDPRWTIETGSALDAGYVRSLGQFDVVYSWGVLHHTGAMWQALENAILPTSAGGSLFISIYNDQGALSNGWRRIKRAYCRLPTGFKWVVLWPTFAILWGPAILRDTLKGQPLRKWRNYKKLRGMSVWSDVVDWVGGYPFEVAKPEVIFDFYHQRGFLLDRLVTCGGALGCNQYVFSRTKDAH